MLYRSILLTNYLLAFEVDEFFELFLRAIEESVAQNENMQKLLVWTNDKTKQTHETLDKYKQYALHFWYIYLAFAPDLALALALALDCDLALDRAFDFKLNPSLALDHIKVKTLNYPKIKERLSKLLDDKSSPKQIQLKFEKIREDFLELSGLSLLYNYSNSDSKFVKSLNWDKKFTNNVKGYLKANKLLIDCLDLAFVSDKQSILDRLALPASDKNT